MDRFRPNLVVTGAEPWAEDTWDQFEIGEASLRGIVPWPRCTIPQVDQQTAERHKEPAKVLKKHRWCTSAPSIPGDFRAHRRRQRAIWDGLHHRSGGRDDHGRRCGDRRLEPGSSHRDGLRAGGLPTSIQSGRW